MHREALDLFGGRAAVLQRMTASVRGKLMAISERRRVKLMGGLGLSRDTLKAILEEDKPVDIELFNTLEGPLGLSIHNDALGDPKFRNADRGYWENQRMHRRPLFVVACGGGMGEIPDDPIDLRSYVTLRAICEFHT